MGTTPSRRNEGRKHTIRGTTLWTPAVRARAWAAAAALARASAACLRSRSARPVPCPTARPEVARHSAVTRHVGETLPRLPFVDSERDPEADPAQLLAHRPAAGLPDQRQRRPRRRARLQAHRQ